MAVAQPQLGVEGLAADTHRVLLAGPPEELVHPPLCPNCGTAASVPVPVAKVFMYQDHHHDGAGWRHRVARATPLFCPACADRHRAEAEPVTAADRLRSGLLTELALPGLGLAAFGSFLLVQTGARLLRDPQREWPILVLIGVLFLLSLGCFRTAWTNNAHRRVPEQTATSRAFDFGDDANSALATTLRTYAIRDGRCAAAFERLNEARSAALLGPSGKPGLTPAFWITGAVILLLTLLTQFLRAR